MHVTSIVLTNFKALSMSIAPKSPALCVIGKMGSGKTSVIEAVRLVLLMPTRHKDADLGGLSPTGYWKATVTIDGVTYGRGMSSGEALYEIDGQRVKFAAYKEAVEAVVKLEGYQIDLSEFLGLSGQKRAELFARLVPLPVLQPGDAIQAAVGMELATFIKAHAGPDCPVPDLKLIPGQPSALVEQVRAATNELKVRQKAAKATLEKLQTERPAGGTRAKAELQTDLEACQQEIGAQRQRVQDIARAGEQLAAAQKAVANLADAAAAAAKAVAQAENLEKVDLPAAHEAVRREEEALTAHHKAMDDTQALVRSQAARAEQATAEAHNAGARKRVAELLPLVELTQDEVRKNMEGPGFAVLDPKEQETLFRVFYRAVLETVADRWRTDGDEDIRKAKEKIASSRTELARLEGMITEINNRIGAGERKVSQAKTTVDRLQDKAAQLPTLRERAAQLETQRLNAAAATQGAAAIDDADVLQQQATETQARADALRAEIAALDKAHGIAGQIDRARLEAQVFQEQATALTILTERMQEWRDGLARQGMDGLVGAISRYLSLLMGPGVKVSIRGGDAGRSTTFQVVVTREGYSVPLEQLSGGETVMAAAAFISAMQDEGKAGMKILTVDAEALDTEGLGSVLMNLPKLGRDFLVLANNRAEGPAPAEWGWSTFKCQPGSTGRVPRTEAVTA